MYYRHHPLYLLDTLLHRLHAPQFMKNPVCRAFDRWIMGDDGEE